MRRIVSRLALLSVVAALLLLAQPASSQSDITITDLGPVCWYCGPVDLNNQGHVVGWDNAGSTRSIQFVWAAETGRMDLTDTGWQSYVYINDRGQVVTTSYMHTGGVQAVLVEGDEETGLGHLGGGFAVPHDINELGHVVGEGYNAEGDLHPFLWTPQSGIQDLGTLGYKSESRALAINDLGWVVGESLTVDLENHAFLWTPRHGMRDLGTLGGSESEAEGINNLGQVVGGSYTDTGVFHAFLSTDKSKMADLGTLGGAFSTAFDINDLGHVVGWSSTSSGEGHAFLWTPEGGMQDLGALDGVSSAAICINDLDHIAGIRWLTTGGTLQTRGFLWTPTEGMRDLGPLPGHQNSEVVDINNEGQVVGWSAEGTSQRHMVLWTVPPPPSGPEPRDPEDRLAALISEIEELVDNGVLNEGQGNALIQKLQNALRMLLEEKTPATCGQLQAFINQVEAYKKTGVLPEKIGLELIGTANDVIGEVCG